MVKSDCPFLTRSPSLKFLDTRMPVTRARTSTSREPAVWPTYSHVTGSACAFALVTVTSDGGMPPPGPWPPPPFSLPLEGLHAATRKGSNAAMDSGRSLARSMRKPELEGDWEGADSTAGRRGEYCRCNRVPGERRRLKRRCGMRK